MTLFRKTMQTFYKKLYNYLFCITKTSSFEIKTDFCDNCREYLLNQSEDDSSISDIDYNKIYLDSAKLDSF